MRQLAETVVDLREGFTTQSGDPDWRGATYAYRSAMGEVLAEGGVRREEMSTFQNALRYHVSNVLHERLDEETLEAIGLSSTSARERGKASRAQRSAVYRAARGDEAPIAALRGLQGALSLLQRVDEGTLQSVTPEEAEHALALLSKIERRAKALSKASK